MRRGPATRASRSASTGTPSKSGKPSSAPHLPAGARVAALLTILVGGLAVGLKTFPSLSTAMTSPAPPPFPWGVASSAFQIEGAASTDGKGPSIWDTFSHTPGKVLNNDTGDVACDFYHRYEADIALMASLGVSAFRFSLAWSRILPTGKGAPNPAGIAFYHRVLDALAAAGIEPHVSLYHWDLPQALEDEYGGWLSPKAVDDFAAYAALAFREYGGKVKFWSTFNEPYTFAFCGYAYGIHAPGRCSDRAKCEGGGNSETEPWLVSHHVLLAHAQAVQAFRRASIPGGRISINLNAEWAEPASSTPADAAAASRYLDFQLGLYAEPIFLTGDYPASVRARVPSLPAFTPEQSAALKGSADYFALNHYTSRWVRDVPRGDPAGAPADAQALTELDGKPIGPRAASFWLFAVPWGFRKLLHHVHDAYAAPAGGLDVWITESGCDGPGEASARLPAVLNDSFRLDYYKGYVSAAVEAAAAGVPIKGYFAWSLLDNFEWAEGYTSRFGITYVDYATQERHPKASAKWLAARFRGAKKKNEMEEEEESGGGKGGEGVRAVA